MMYFQKRRKHIIAYVMLFLTLLVHGCKCDKSSADGATPPEKKASSSYVEPTLPVTPLDQLMSKVKKIVDKLDDEDFPEFVEFSEDRNIKIREIVDKLSQDDEFKKMKRVFETHKDDWGKLDMREPKAARVIRNASGDQITKFSRMLNVLDNLSGADNATCEQRKALVVEILEMEKYYLDIRSRLSK